MLKGVLLFTLVAFSNSHQNFLTLPDVLAFRLGTKATNSKLFVQWHQFLSLFFFFALEANFPYPPEVKKKKNKKTPTFWEYWSIEPTFLSCLCGKGPLLHNLLPLMGGATWQTYSSLGVSKLGASRLENWSHGFSAYWEPAGAPSAPFSTLRPCPFLLSTSRWQRPQA